MSSWSRSGTVATVLILGILAAATASAQTPPSNASSLNMGPIDLFLTGSGLANETPAQTDNACVGISPQGAPNAPAGASKNFPADPHGPLAVHSEPGNYYPTGASVTVDLTLTAPNAADPEAGAVTGPTGFEIRGTLGWGGNLTLNNTFVQGASPNRVTSASLIFDLPAEVNPGSDPLTLGIAFVAGQAGGTPLPVNALDAAVQCGPNSLIAGLTYARGVAGDGDLDGDSIPDSEDPDKDNDGMDNELDGVSNCFFEDQPVDFSSSASEAENDHDGDGFTDQDECTAGSNPLNANSFPAPERGFPWVALILFLVIVALLVGLFVLFLKFGRVGTLTLVSATELIVEAGKTGRFELALENRKSKGDAVTFQILAEGIPEGWDAKTDVDHVSVEPQGQDGSRKTFFLSVESPDHQDPESAVVTVKAVPLNKQGRKDTFKLAAKAETITSINVPPDAKVPVKRGGPVKLKAPGEESGPAAIPIPPEGLPVKDLPGVSAAQAKKLESAGVTTTEKLRTADAAALAKQTKIGQADLERWQRVSDLIRVPGVTPEYGEALVGAGIESTGSLAGWSADELADKLNTYLASREAA